MSYAGLRHYQNTLDPARAKFFGDMQAKVTDLTMADLTTHGSGDAVMVGEIPIQLLHTPGHTPGSQCFYVNGCLVSGDTLFLDGCGRTDLDHSSLVSPRPLDAHHDYLRANQKLEPRRLNHCPRSRIDIIAA